MSACLFTNAVLGAPTSVGHRYGDASEVQHMGLGCLLSTKDVNGAVLPAVLHSSIPHCAREVQHVVNPSQIALSTQPLCALPKVWPESQQDRKSMLPQCVCAVLCPVQVIARPVAEQA